MTANLPYRRAILVVEDEPSIRDNLTWSLESDGWTAVACATCGEARMAMIKNDFVLAILDIGLPDGNGLDLCNEIRKSSSIPVIFLTARSSEIDRVVGLEIGGDDYVSKPFSPRELTARVRAVLRRAAPEVGGVNVDTRGGVARFEVNKDRYEILFHGIRLDLSRTEFRILEVFIARPGQVFSRAQLMDHAWDEPDASMERTVDTHIKSLRAKLRALCPDEETIRTHRGVGYSLE